MHLIIQGGNTSLLKIVAQFDPDYKIANNLGDTPLHVAVSNNDIKMVQLLKALCGADLLEIKNKMGQKPGDLSTDTKMKFEL
jgi:ankyrin repeat protein